MYSHVARRTIAEPRINVAVMRKSKSATLARNESTMLRLVAKPLRILSEYLITSAVTSPPRTCTHTVAHAHAPKCAKSPANGAPLPPAACCANRIGASAGRSEKSERRRSVTSGRRGTTGWQQRRRCGHLGRQCEQLRPTPLTFAAAVLIAAMRAAGRD